MASESRTEYKVVADKIVSPDNNINFVVAGNVYVGASEAGNRVATISDIGEGGGLPTDFTNVSSDIIASQDNIYSLGSTENRWKELFLGPGTIYITDSVTGEDAGISVGDGVLNIDGIAQAQLPVLVVDEIRFSDNTSQTTASTGSGAGTGDITFVATTMSSDTGNNIVIENKNDSGIVKARITLDQSNEQVLIEAINSSDSGFTTSDWATATWSGNALQINGTANGVIAFFNNLNGNVTHIQINNDQTVRYDGGSYGSDNITIYTVETAPAESDPVTITELNFIYGVVSKIDIDYDDEELLIKSVDMDINIESTNEINLDADDDIDLNATNRVRVYGDTNVFLNSQNGGVFIGTSVENDNVNQVATLGDVEQAIETGPAEVSFTVNGGTLGDQPTFTGDPLFSGTYVKTGPLVHFQIQVDMDNITSFGTGQYYVDLPFAAKYGYQVREGCLHDISADRQYAIGGHVAAGQSRLNLFFTDTNGQDQEFDYNSPVTLAVADNFHVSGTYIIQEGV